MEPIVLKIACTLQPRALAPGKAAGHQGAAGGHRQPVRQGGGGWSQG